MSEHPFKTFINLITFDQEINSIEKEIITARASIAHLQEEIKHIDVRLETARLKAHDARKAVDALELEVQELEVQEKFKKRQLETLSNYKEYQSLKNEIERLMAKQNELEQKVLDAWNVLEVTNKEFELVKHASEQQKQELLHNVEQKKQTIQALEQSLKMHHEQRPAKEQQVPAEWLEKYAVMRSRVADPVVPVQNGSCTACFYDVSDQDMISLKRKKLLQCKGCYRLLYSTELEQDAAEVS